MAEYTSPGAAFSNALETQLVQQAAQKRQAMLDHLAAQKEADLADYRKQEIAARHEEIQSLRESRQQQEKSAGQTAFDKRLERKQPGDILTSDMLAEGKKYGYSPEDLQQPGTGTPATAGQPGQAAAPVTLPGADLSGAPVSAQVMAPEIPAQAAAAAQPALFLGNPAQRQKQTLEAKVRAISDKLSTVEPNSPEFKQLAAEYEMVAGKSLPAGIFKSAGSESVPVMTHAEALRLGQVPPGTKILEPPQPKDTSARDDREARHLDDVHKTAVAELNKRAQPFESHVQTVNDLSMALNERTPQADALIAPLVLKATVSGAGTGFRMTQSEINQVIGGRSKWQSLEAALNKWSTDRTKALSITDEQRTELRSLAKKIREKATTMSRKVVDARHQLDDAKTPADIHKIMTKVQEDLNASDVEESTATETAGKSSAADLIKKYGGK